MEHHSLRGLGSSQGEHFLLVIGTSSMSHNEFPSSDPNYNSNPSTGSFGPVYPNQAPQPQPQPQPQFAAQPAPTFAYTAPAYPQQRSGTSGAMIALISVLVVVLLGLVGAVLYVTLSKDDSVTAADTQTAATTQAAADASSQPNPPVTQTETVVVQDSSGSSGNSGSSRSSGLAGGNLSSAWKGTSSTSDPFVRNVHSAYVRYRNSTGAESGTITAYSPTTGLTYNMWCRPAGGNIKCTGGRNAVVYIG
ncbi:hypothetical protein HMPREF2657_00985 [Corynebacterium sp. HMSC072B08]|nr:hypothetical protein [Corynebacterium sp. LK31]OFR59939.1 hypothetical protein HMPREF2878_00960 [Corynebacterium sp. HMSC065H09]OHQ63753.1 hypothetical protein HMPREF2657_00985 [Corynebacterium sp. HMSC072B08]